MPFSPPTHRPPGVKPAAQRRAEFDKQRNKEKNATYDAAWRACSKQFLKAHPRCDAILPSGLVCGAASVDADHVLSPKTHPHLRLRWSNLRSRCHSCHSRRTAKEQGFANMDRRNY